MYLANDYGIEYYAAFPGCSAESEASFETIAFLAEKIKEVSGEEELTGKFENLKEIRVFSFEPVQYTGIIQRKYGFFTCLQKLIPLSP